MAVQQRRQHQQRPGARARRQLLSIGCPTPSRSAPHDRRLADYRGLHLPLNEVVTILTAPHARAMITEDAWASAAAQPSAPAGSIAPLR